MHRKYRGLRLAALVTILFLGCFALAETGVSDTEIRVGSTGALSGSIQEIGGGLALGAKVFYDRLNLAGGVNGRKIVFLPKDDVYDPAKAVVNAKELIETDQVFAFIGGNGTPIAQAILPLVNSQSIPFMFTQTGGSSLYPEPPLKNVFQLRMSYSDEAASLIHFAVKRLELKKIGVFYQDDSFGTAGRAGVEKALADFHMKASAFSTYTRNTVLVDKAVDEMIAAAPDVIYMQAVAQPAIAFIKRCLEKKFHPVFLGPSPIGSLQLQKLLGSVPADVYISEVLPSPNDPSLPLVARFQKDMAAAGAAPLSYFMLEGYMGAAVFAEAIKRVGKDVTRAKLFTTLESLHDLNFEGLPLTFSPKSHVGLEKNYIVRLRAGELKTQ